MAEAVANNKPTLLRSALGGTLRDVRKRRGWTRQVFRDKLLEGGAPDRSLQTIASHELGTRSMTVEQLFDYCRILQIDPGVVFTQASDTLLNVSPEGGMRVNLDKLARASVVILHPIKKWARLRQVEMAAAGIVDIVIDPDTLEHLATLCDTDRLTLECALAAL